MANWMKRSFSKRPWRALPLLAMGLLVAYQGASSFAGAAAQDPRSKVEAAVLEKAAKGETTFWILLHEKANLAPAFGMDDDARGEFVYRELTDVADRSQTNLRAELKTRGATFQPFWILNAIQVTGDAGLVADLAARDDVKAIVDGGVFRIPDPIFEASPPEVTTIGWNIESVRAFRVWSDFNVRGENIVVANIDTGVHYTHPALVNQYRGNLGAGNFDHNYNWWDPSNICGNPSNAPCDNNSHGTHTMGTMVGDDGNPGPNQIGVAPKAKWIACKGCETNSCSNTALLSCGQFILAPTDLAGQNPQPSLRPHVVNNSWAGGGGNPWYSATVNAWVASGIFPAFAIGNTGPSCGSADSPGDYVASYAAGAHTQNRLIAGFSSRGPSAFGGEIKPNISAPGVSVRSSVPPNGYSNGTGTSMASPHVAGAVALLWSRSQTIRRDINATRSLLDDGAKDKSDLTCGGTADDNHVWGEGLLDTLGPVREAPLP
jgi:subtilisin family serine protease